MMISPLRLGREYQDSPESHILAYRLVVIAIADKENEYRRIGIAKVSYEWICHAPTVTISLA